MATEVAQPAPSSPSSPPTSGATLEPAEGGANDAQTPPKPGAKPPEHQGPVHWTEAQSQKPRWDVNQRLFALTKVLPLGTVFALDFGIILSPPGASGNPLDGVPLKVCANSGRGRRASVPACLGGPRASADACPTTRPLSPLSHRP